MSDDPLVVSAAEDARNRHAERRVLRRVAFAGAFFLLVVLLFFWSFARSADLQRQVNTLSSAVDKANAAAETNAAAARTLSSQVLQLGGTPSAHATPAPGTPARGITGTSIANGHLVVAYTDGTLVDVGQVVGKDGAQGATGRGITGSSITSGHLVLSYSDNTTADVGQVVGKDGAPGASGRGVTSIDGSSGRLLITYTDGTTQDAGPLPVGPAGPKGDKGDPGAPGPACPDGYEQHQAVITASDGTKYDGVACVRPNSATTTTTPPPLLGNGKR